MDNLADKILKSTETNNILFWSRYMDDVLASFVGSDRQL